MTKIARDMKRFHLIEDRAQRRKAERGKCISPRCRNDAPAVGFVCHKCRQAKWRRNNPLRSAFATLRDHARGRGIVFKLTFKHFRKVAIRAGYVQGLNGAHGLSVDRRRDELGYVNGNIRIISFSANVAKENRRRARERAGGYVAKAKEGCEYGECPF